MNSLLFILVVLAVVPQRHVEAQECVCTCTTVPSALTTPKAVPETSPQAIPTTTIFEVPSTVESSTSSCSAAPCDQISEQIVVDSSNSSALTTAINEAYDTWNVTEQNVFLGYKKKIEKIVFGETTSTDSEEEQIAQVVSGFTNNAARAKDVYDIQIACWGTIRQYVECVNSVYGTNYKIW